MTEAICIGINSFANFPKNGLNGCVNDARAMSRFFQAESGADVVTLLLETRATKKKIMDAVKTALGRADRLYLSISSHGSQVADKDKDEDDGLDECIICHDTTGQFGNVITDDELWLLFAQYPKVQIECYFDLCHSGTGTRFVRNVIPRFLHNAAVKKAKEKSAPKVQLSNVTLWAGCKPNEYSYDAEINGTWCGAFTRNLLNAYKSKTSRRVIFAKLTKSITKDFSQHPQLECSTKQLAGPIFK